MRTYRIQIGLENVAFTETPGDEGIEIARILRKIADRCFDSGIAEDISVLLDCNGNRVGWARTLREGGPE